MKSQGCVKVCAVCPNLWCSISISEASDHRPSSLSAFIRGCGPQWFCKCVDMQRSLYADPNEPAGLENPQEPCQTGLCIPAPQEIGTDPACAYLQRFSDCRSLPFCKLVDFQLHRSSKISILANLQVSGAPQICALASPQSEKLCRSLLIWSCKILQSTVLWRSAHSRLW